MKIALISDIHGNYPALKAVFNKIRQENCDLVVSLGDVAGYYCMVNECIHLCKKEGVVNILGNHDYYLTSGTGCPRSSTANSCLEFQRKIITFDNLEWLRASRPAFRDLDCWFVHGGWNDPLDEYVDSFDFSRFLDCGVMVYASGHTHIQQLQRFGHLTYVNPGSVGQPRDGNPKAAFAVINMTGVVSLHRVEYDVDEIVSAMADNNFESRLFEGLYTGTRIQRFNNRPS